jgi:hypothetical protein
LCLITTASLLPGARHPLSPGNSGSLEEASAGGYSVESTANIVCGMHPTESMPASARTLRGRPRFQVAAFITKED